jgi:ribosomal protein S7
MQHLNSRHHKQLCRSITTIDRLLKLYASDCCPTQWKYQPNGATVDTSSEQTSTLHRICRALNASGKNGVGFNLTKEEGNYLVLFPQEKCKLNLVAGYPFQGQSWGVVSPLLGRLKLPAKILFSGALIQSPLSQGVPSCLPTLSLRRMALFAKQSETRVPRYISKFVNLLMRHGKKGLAIGLLVRSLLLFLQRLREGKHIASRPIQPQFSHGGQRWRPALINSQGLIGQEGVLPFPFYVASSSPIWLRSDATWQRGNAPLTDAQSFGHCLPSVGEAPLPPLSYRGRCRRKLIPSTESTSLLAPVKRPPSPLFEGGPRLPANSPLARSFVIDYLRIAIANVEPSLEVRKKKIAGITRQIPSAVPKTRGERLAIRWLVEAARDKSRKRGRGLAECLADELIDAYAKRGEPRQRRDSMHRQAESNRSFIRYRWW